LTAYRIQTSATLNSSWIKEEDQHVAELWYNWLYGHLLTFPLETQYTQTDYQDLYSSLAI
jgi:hypothetical protein